MTTNYVKCSGIENTLCRLPVGNAWELLLLKRGEEKIEVRIDLDTKVPFRYRFSFPVLVMI